MATDARPVRVQIDVDVRYVVDEGWLRSQMLNDEDDIDEVARAYCLAIEEGEMTVPEGHVEFASVEFDTRHPAHD